MTDASQATGIDRRHGAEPRKLSFELDVCHDVVRHG